MVIFRCDITVSGRCQVRLQLTAVHVNKIRAHMPQIYSIVFFFQQRSDRYVDGRFMLLLSNHWGG